MHSEELKSLFPFAAPPDELILASQTGDRLKYHPETTEQEIAVFPQHYQNALDAVDHLYETIENNPPSNGIEDQKQRTLIEIRQAQAQLRDGQLPVTKCDT